MEISFNLHCVQNKSQVKFKIPNKRRRGVNWKWKSHKT